MLFITKYWFGILLALAIVFSFGAGYKMRADKCERDNWKAVQKFQNVANEQAKSFEDERAKIEANRRKVANVKIIHTGCTVTVDGMSKLNAIITDDTSKFN